MIQPQLELGLRSSNETSIKQKFRAVWTSLCLTTPSSYSDRLRTITQIVLDDTLTSLDQLNADDDPSLKLIDTAIIAIAIGAYWHHDLASLRSRLLALQDNCRNYEFNIQELVLAYAIAYGCQGNIKIQQLIDQICEDFSCIIGLSRRPEEQLICLSQLQLAQKFVNQGASAIAAHNARNDHNDDLYNNPYLSQSIASSLYYVLSTPHNWLLVTQHAQQQIASNPHPKVTPIQAGAIAAAYGALPSLSLHNQPQQTRDQSREYQIGEIVWNQWSGTYSTRPLSLRLLR